MREKKYFCDWYEKNRNRLGVICVIVFCIISSLVFCWFGDNALDNSYDENKYAILENSINTILKDGKLVIDEDTQLPLNVKTEIVYDEYSNKTLKCTYVEENIPLAGVYFNVSVDLSSSNKELKRNFSSKEDYINSRCFNEIFMCFLLGYAIGCIIYIIVTILLEIINTISESKKKKAVAKKDEFNTETQWLIDILK